MLRIRVLLLFLIAIFIGSQVMAEGRETDKAKILEIDKEMVAALNAGDVNHYMGFLAENATWMPPAHPVVVGKDEIRKLVSQLCETPNYTVVHHPGSIEVSSSGELAYFSYTYEFTVTSASGETVTEKGKDISIFRKAGGYWKLAIDIWNSDESPMDL